MAGENRWLNTRTEGGKAYDAKFVELAEAGVDVHGEADFVMGFQPVRVLDAGCGTGRVAIELARRGCRTVGVDLDPAMLDQARAKAPALDWLEGDLAEVQLNQTFDLIVMAGNVMLFVTPGTEGQVVLNLARHLETAGTLIAGFSLSSELGLERYHEFCTAAGLQPVANYATWDRQPFHPAADYIVTVYKK